VQRLNASSVLLQAECCGSWFYADLANSVGALQIWPENRYYAESLPFLPNDNLQHLSIEQAMVDHVELVLYLQNLLSMDHNPVIAIGSSYSKLLRGCEIKDTLTSQTLKSTCRHDA